LATRSGSGDEGTEWKQESHSAKQVDRKAPFTGGRSTLEDEWNKLDDLWMFSKLL